MTEVKKNKLILNEADISNNQQSQQPGVDSVVNNTRFKFKDWKNAISASDDPDSVYDQFFAVTFRGIDQSKINKIRSALAIELGKLGFSEYENPFITFINKYFKDNDMSQVQYNEIHNSYIDDLITDDDLRGKGKLGKDNVIFKQSFYNNNPTSMDMHKVLEYQDKLMNENTVDNLVEGTVGQKRVKDAYKRTGGDWKQLLFDIIYEPFNAYSYGRGDIVDYKQNSPDNDVRPANEISKIYAYCFGSADGDKSNNETKENWKDVIDNEYKKGGDLQLLMLAIISKFANNINELRKLEDKYYIYNDSVSMGNLKLADDLINHLNIVENNYRDILDYTYQLLTKRKA